MRKYLSVTYGAARNNNLGKRMRCKADPAHNSRLRLFGWLKPMMQKLPMSMIKVISPMGYSMLQLQMTWASYIDAIRAEGKASQPSGKTVFHALLANPDLPADQKGNTRLVDEAMNFLGAAPVTANVLRMIAYHIIANPEAHAKMIAELKTIMPTPTSETSLAQLEALPYFSAVICEGLRLAYGLIPRSQRVHREPLRYRDWVIPAYTPVAMTSKMTHDDPAVYPEPAAFKPERWLGEEGRALRAKYWLSFGKGTRKCLGENLATCTLYLTIAHMFRRFEGRLRLVGVVKERDVDISHDFLNTSTALDSPGVFIVVDSDRQNSE